jgi:2-methylcitrate dehydratase
MEKISFDHGGPEYDQKYPDGIPTSVIITTDEGQTLDSGLVMYPAGHARNTTADLGELLQNKWRQHTEIAVSEPQRIIDRFNALPTLSANQLAALYDFDILDRGPFE